MSSLIETKLKEKNQAILTSIAENGLHASATSERLRSYEPEACNALSINIVDLTQGRRRDYQPVVNSTANEEDINVVLSNLIYSTTQGAWPIVVERSFDCPTTGYFELEERLANSLLIILKPPIGDRYEKHDTVVSANFDSSHPEFLFSNVSKFFTNEGLFSFELGTQHKFTAENDIIAIICPKKMEEQLKIHFKKVLIVPVQNRLQSVKVIVDPKAKSERTKTYQLNGPDYEGGLRRLMTQNGLKRFSCHATRLLTRMDFLKLHKNTLDRKEVLASYNTTDIDHAFRKAAALGHVAEMELLLEYGAKLDVQAPKSRKTALHYAIKYNQTLSIAFLLERGASKSLKDEEDKLDAEMMAQRKSIKLCSLSELEKLRFEEQQRRGFEEAAAKLNEVSAKFGGMQGNMTAEKLMELKKLREQREQQQQQQPQYQQSHQQHQQQQQFLNFLQQTQNLSSLSMKGRSGNVATASGKKP